MALTAPTQRTTARRTRTSPVRRYRFTPEQFYQLDALGILDPNKRYELIHGEIYEMATIGPEHGFSTELLLRRLIPLEKPGKYCLRFQNPLRLGDSEPIPDLAVVPGSPSDYRTQHPTTALLVVEVADTSLTHDRGRKLRLYAKAGIPEYWIVNLKERVLEVYREPARSRYKSKQVLGQDATIRPLFNPAVELAVRQLFE